MGSNNHGTQTITNQFYEEITALNRNKRICNIIPRGVYSGGYLTKVSDVEVTLSPLVVEIGDSTSQVRIKTVSAATINDSTLDSGTISISTPYIILRWAYVASVANYMEVHAVSSAVANDIIVGKISFSGATITGFDYTERTFLNVQNLFLKPEASETSEMYIRLRAGKIHSNIGYVLVQEQKVGPFIAPAAPNSRIDLVYINDTGAVQILQGTAAVSPSAPSYSGRLVVAEVTVANGVTSIVSSNIKDVRSFITPRAVSDGTITFTKMKKYDSGWFSVGLNTTYTKSHGLGVEPSIVLVYISENADGSGRRTAANGSSWFVHTNINLYAFGTVICKVDSSNVKIRTGIQSIAQIRDENGNVWIPTSAYARILAIE